MSPSWISKNLLDSTFTMLYKGRMEGGVVNFKGNKPSHPVMFNLYAKNIGFSDIFFIDNGFTELSVRYVNKDKKVTVRNEMKSKTQKEYEALKREGLDSIENLLWQSPTREERRKFSKSRDTLIVNFLKKNPSSYVPLWLLADDFSLRSQEYNQLYDESLSLFSNEIKATELFKRLKESLEGTKNFSLNNKELPLQNLNLEDVQFKLSSLNNSKYILLDFWFSNCGPCLLEMREYIPLYEKYKELGFEIVSISIDKTSKIQDWKTVIKEKGFNWAHYLDENGVETTKLNIISFPTTFLVEGNGTLIEKDIELEKLADFLSLNLD